MAWVYHVWMRHCVWTTNILMSSTSCFNLLWKKRTHHACGTVCVMSGVHRQNHTHTHSYNGCYLWTIGWFIDCVRQMLRRQQGMSLLYTCTRLALCCTLWPPTSNHPVPLSASSTVLLDWKGFVDHIFLATTMWLLKQLGGHIMSPEMLKRLEYWSTFSDTSATTLWKTVYNFWFPIVNINVFYSPFCQRKRSCLITHLANNCGHSVLVWGSTKNNLWLYCWNNSQEPSKNWKICRIHKLYINMFCLSMYTVKTQSRSLFIICNFCYVLKTWLNAVLSCLPPSGSWSSQTRCGSCFSSAKPSLVLVHVSWSGPHVVRCGGGRSLSVQILFWGEKLNLFDNHGPHQPVDFTVKINVFSIFEYYNLMMCFGAMHIFFLLMIHKMPFLSLILMNSYLGFIILRLFTLKRVIFLFFYFFCQTDYP